MKRVYIFLLCCFILSTNVLAAEAKFNDIDGHWAESTIEKWQDSGFISGYPDGSFKPDNPVTRAELAKMLALAFDLQEGEQRAYTDMFDSIMYDLQEGDQFVYTDVSEGDWFYPYVEKSARYIPVYPLVVGYDSNRPYSENQGGEGFLPNVNALRVHVAEALVKIKIEKENIVVENEPSIQEMNKEVYEVFNNDPEYFNLYGNVHGIPINVRRMNYYTWWAYKLDIMNGRPDGIFDPYGYMTRAELVTAVDRMMK